MTLDKCEKDTWYEIVDLSFAGNLDSSVFRERFLMLGIQKGIKFKLLHTALNTFCIAYPNTSSKVALRKDEAQLIQVKKL